MSLLVGCPVILPPRDDVLASWNYRPHALVVNGQPELWERRMVHDRAPGFTWLLPRYEGNRGVAASWNIIFAHARVHDYSHVALVSQGVMLEGGTARLAELVDEYADWRGLLTDFAFHCIVFSVQLWEQIGPFDDAFFAYFEDSDYVRRLFLAGLHTPENRMPKVGRDLLDGTETTAAAIHLIPDDTYGRSASRFRAKWGGDPFKETYDRPFNREAVDPTNNWSTQDSDHQGRLVTEGDSNASER